jgi:hypothetical protein
MLAVGANKCSIVSECALAILSIYIALPLRDPYKMEAGVIYHLNPYPPYPYYL